VAHQSTGPAFGLGKQETQNAERQQLENSSGGYITTGMTAGKTGNNEESSSEAHPKKREGR
jgi:hypothetical protein